ncbi:MAG: hypothetical protein FWD45_00200 [Coriobacteriia bacterium]|nr:hypothetical protein [Coriobacteriia bacterium]
MEQIRVKPDDQGRIIIRLFGQDYEIIVDKEGKAKKPAPKDEPDQGG